MLRVRMCQAALVCCAIVATSFAHGGSITGRISVSATVVGSCILQTPAAQAPKGDSTAVISACSPGVAPAASVEDGAVPLQGVYLEQQVRTPGPAIRSVTARVPATSASSGHQPPPLSDWQGGAPVYVTLTY